MFCLLKRIRCALPVAACLVSMGAQAASDAEIQLVHDTVRSQYGSVADYCKVSDDERRKKVIQVTMALASKRQIRDPVDAGPKAGALLRKACGNDASFDVSKLRWSASAPALRFSPERGSWGMFTSPQSLANKVFTPEGSGPFPAVVLSQAKKMSEHMKVHAKEFLEAGFAVLVVDTYGPRGYQIGVNEPFPAEFARDAYDALAHLHTLPYIDKSRIYQTGYSNGGLAAALLASPKGAEEFKAQERFRATVAQYGSCTIASPYAGQAQVTQLDMLSTDSDRPILMLMGEMDIETPAKSCFPRLEEMKAMGKDVHWHIYPGTSHGWDQAEHSGFVFRTNNGETMTYRYDEAVAKDATARAIAFFNRYR